MIRQNSLVPLFALLLAIAMLSTGSLRGQGVWERQPGPYGGMIVEMVANDETGTIMASAGAAGILRSTDRGASWDTVVLPAFRGRYESLSQNLQVGRGGDFWTINNYGQLYRSIDDGRSWRLVGDWSRSWRDTTIGRIRIIAAGDTILLHEDGGSSQRRQWRSSDDGRTWTELKIPYSPGSTTYFTPLWPLMMGTTIIGYFETTRSLIRSTDVGLSWEVIPLMTPDFRGARNIVVIDSLLYTFDKDLLYRSVDTGRTWDSIYRTPDEAEIHSFAHQNGIYYLHAIRKVYRSQDQGFDLTRKLYSGRNLSSFSDSMIVLLQTFDPRLPILSFGDTLILGTGSGIYRSVDGGGEWPEVGGREVLIYGLVFNDRATYAISVDPHTRYEEVMRRADGESSWSIVPIPFHGSSSTVRLLHGLGGDSVGIVYENERLTHIALSADGGETWESNRVADFPNDFIDKLYNQWSYGGCLYLHFAPVYISSTDTTQFRIVRSCDGGKTWDSLAPALWNSLPFGNQGRIAWHVAYDATSLTSVVGRAEEGRMKLRYFRSHDSARSWQMIDTVSYTILPLTFPNQSNLATYANGSDSYLLYLRENDWALLHDDEIDTVRLKGPRVYLPNWLTYGQERFHQLNGSFWPGRLHTRSAGDSTWQHLPLDDDDSYIPAPASSSSVYPIRDPFHWRDTTLYLTPRTGGYYRYRPDSVPPAPPYRLTVVDGYGSGSYDAGDTVHIWSHALPGDSLFLSWSAARADDEVLPALRDEWHTTLVMPPRDVTVTATYGRLSGATDRDDTIPGIVGRIRSAWPSGDARGLILVFHDSNSSAARWWESVEGEQFLKDALHRGFAVAAWNADKTWLDSTLIVNARRDWTLTPGTIEENVDLYAVNAVPRLYRQENLMRDTTRLYALGIGSGAHFAALASKVFLISAAAVYCNGGDMYFYREFNLPTIFNVPTLDPYTDVAAAHDNALRLDWRLVPSEFHVASPSPFYPERLARVAGITPAESRAIVARAHWDTLIDERGYLYPSLPDWRGMRVLRKVDDYPSLAGLTSDQQGEVIAQMNVATADHEFFSDLNKATLRFFAAVPPRTSGVESERAHAGSLMSVAPQPVSGEAHVAIDVPRAGIVSLTLHDLLGREVVTLLEGERDAGIVTVRWDATDIAAGVYLLRLVTAEGVRVVEVRVVR